MTSRRIMVLFASLAIAGSVFAGCSKPKKSQVPVTGSIPPVTTTMAKTTTTMANASVSPSTTAAMGSGTTMMSPSTTASPK